MGEGTEKARGIFLDHGGILRSSEARSLGIHPETISRMVREGFLEREGRGLYRLAEIEPGGNADLIQVAKLVPQGVVCLISALSFHGLTTEIPYRVYIALPQGTKKPKLAYPPLKVVWLSGEAYSSGIDRRELDGVQVPIYSREKTVADCFKFRGKLGIDIAIEALRDYLRLADRNLDELLRFARIDRVEKAMRPYLEALL